MQRTEYFVDLLNSAVVEAPGENCVDVEKMILVREVETAIFQHPPATIRFQPIRVGKNARLHFGCGIKQAAWPHLRSPVGFLIEIRTEPKKAGDLVFKIRLNPRIREADRAWQRNEIDLSVYEGQLIHVVLQTSVGWRRSTEYAWAGWANPRIVHDVRVEPPARRVDPHRHIFLITADALPARYLASYGHPTIQTPNLDRLANDGVLFEQAWAQSCMTFGSYVSILTGLHPHEHGVSREWHQFPVSLPSLPSALTSNGYHTLFAASSLEISGRNNLLDQLFAENLPTLSNPMQDGAVTTRQFQQAFDHRPDRPSFCWLHYFDVHPPSMPPAPFDSLYYRDDPTHPQHEYLPAEVSRIRSVESALIMRAAMPDLERGQPVAEVIDILEDTAAVLRGQSNQRPDLAEHVLNLGTRATQGQSPNDFGNWLSRKALEMTAGRVPVELVSWLKEMISLLEKTENDITSWLANVVDFRYPLNMYLSTVSYFDAHVGALTNYLKEQDVYDQSLIIVTSPHGEILQNPTLPYHHFLLTPDTLHVPLIMKLPAGAAQQKTGTRVRGLIDLIDLFPTTLEMLGLNHSIEMSGVSRWNEIRDARELPARDSFAAGLHQLSHSVCRPPNLYVREQAGVGLRTFHGVVGGAREIVYDTISGEVCRTDLPELESLKRSLVQEFKSGS